MFHDELKDKMDRFVHLVYKTTRFFPREEIYGVISQLRRSALSVILNYVEGYARQRKAVLKNFLQISYGSLKEAGYLVEFSEAEGFLGAQEKKEIMNLADEIGAMLWKTMENI
ncbi:MAG: four helix bundle protein [Patescibacteria group bacterium]|nr:four helix bundle protein [Patescibacteria group bacterium]